MDLTGRCAPTSTTATSTAASPRRASSCAAPRAPRAASRSSAWRPPRKTEASRIRVLEPGEGVTVARTDVYYVVTEYGIAYLFGKSIRERAVALIEVAHPKFRAELFEQAQALGYLPPEQTLKNMRAYPVRGRRTVALKDARSMLLRRRPQRTASRFASFSTGCPTGRLHPFLPQRARPVEQGGATPVNVNFENEVAFVAVTGPREDPQIVRAAATSSTRPPISRKRLHGPSRVAGVTGWQCAAEANDRACHRARRARLHGRDPASNEHMIRLATGAPRPTSASRAPAGPRDRVVLSRAVRTRLRKSQA